MDAGGKLKSTGDISDCYITDEKSGIASDDKILNIQIPGVEAGCIVEWQATISSNGLNNTFPFTRHLFGSVKPIAVECVFVTGDVKQVKVEFARHDGVEHMESDKFEGWLASCEQPYQWEPWATRSEERRPILWLGGDEGTWEKIGWDYLELIRDRLKPSDDVVIIAKQLTASKKSVPDKIGAILAKLRQDLSYKAIEFGVRGRMPNTPSETLRLRYGDCKDHAVLLHALLGAVGIESRLTLVNTEWMVQDKLPSADQFNHMIVHVPALGEGRWIDPTDKTLAGEQFQADDFWSSSALILDSPKPRFVVPVITAPTPDSCRIRSHRICTPDGQDWKVHETLTLTGYYASWMRNVFVDASEEQQQIKAQEMLSNLGPVRLEKFHFVNVSNASESAVIECEYRVTKVIETLGEESKGPLPALWEKDYLSIRPVRNRKTPFNWRYPLSFESVVEVKLPSNPEDKLEQDEANEFCVWGLNRLPGQSSWKFKFQAKLGKFPADDYTRFQNAWEAAYRSWDKHISWRVSDQ